MRQGFGPYGSMGIDFTLGLPPGIVFGSMLSPSTLITPRGGAITRNINMNSKVTGTQNSCQTSIDQASAS